MSSAAPLPRQTLVRWSRYWRPLGEPTPLSYGDDGFLADPESFWDRGNRSGLTTLPALAQKSPVLVLCGEPGIGKSKELELHRTFVAPASEDALWLALRKVRDFDEFVRRTAGTASWGQWKSGSGSLTLVIDGVDEGLFRIPDFITALTNLLNEVPRERLRLRIACRSAEWPTAQGEALLRLWGESDAPRIYELCPLRMADAAQMAEQRELDSKRFLELVHERHVESFAARPVTLGFLLSEFEARKTLSGTHREIYERGCRQLCSEHDTERAEVLRALRIGKRVASLDERLEAASRLAALLMLSGKEAIHAPHSELESPLPSDLPIAAAATGFALGQDCIHDALESALFVSAGPRRFGFGHQTYAECMATRALAPLPLTQLRALLCARDDHAEHVVPQLAELASWVAGENDEFRQFLLQREPEVLLRSDVTCWTSNYKETLVSALLKKASQGELFEQDAFWPFYSGLRHSRLAAQIRAVIGDPTANDNARRLALTMGRATRLTELTDDLLTLVRDNTQPAWVRHSAVFALEECIPVDRLADLEPLARGEVGPDPDLSIRGCALRRLVPEHWAVRDALPCIQVESGEAIIGSYQTVLSHDLPQHITKADMPAILAATASSSGNSGLKRLADAAVEIGLLHLGEPSIAALLVQTLRAWRRRNRGVLQDPKSRTRKKLDSDLTTRRALVKALMLDSFTNDNDLYRTCFETQLLNGTDDLRWLLDELPEIPAERAVVWCQAIGILASPENLAPHWDFFLVRLAESSALQSQFAWLRAWDTEEPLARNAKARALREKRWRRHLDSRVAATPKAGDLVRTTLEQIRKGSIGLFSDLCFGLSQAPNSSGYDILPLDITEAPGWQAAPHEVHREFGDAARRFLLQCDDGSPAPERINPQSMAGWVAIWHLRNCITGDPELREAVIERWIDALLRFPGSDKDEAQAAFAFAYHLSPERTVEDLLRKAREECESHQHPFIFRRTASVWDERIATAAECFVRQLSNPESLEKTLHELSQLDQSLTTRLIHEIIESGRNATTDNLLETALSAGLLTAADEFWCVARPFFDSDEDFARRVLQRACYGADFRGRSMLMKMKPADLAELYLTLQRLFLPSEDHPFDGGAVSPRQSAIHVRQELPGYIAARGTPEACTALLRLADQLSEESTWLRRLYREALRASRRARWEPPSMEDVRTVIDRREARLVRNEEELHEAVLESLARFQVHLTERSLPAVERFWNYEGAGQQRHAFRPKDEEFLSDEVARWIRDDLGSARGVVVGREVQPVRGKKTDITIEAVSPNTAERDVESTLSITIEVKGCWHKKVGCALETQLVADYLKPHGRTHGIYLVGWFLCERWDGRWSGPKNRLPETTYAEAVEFVRRLAAPFDGQQRPFRISGVVIDLRLPD